MVPGWLLRRVNVGLTLCIVVLVAKLAIVLIAGSAGSPIAPLARSNVLATAATAADAADSDDLQKLLPRLRGARQSPTSQPSSPTPKPALVAQDEDPYGGGGGGEGPAVVAGGAGAGEAAGADATNTDGTAADAYGEDQVVPDKAAKPPRTAASAASSPGASSTAKQASGPSAESVRTAWSKEMRAVLAHYDIEDGPTQCAPEHCPSGLQHVADQIRCCASPTEPIVVVVRSDLVAGNPWYTSTDPARRLHLSVNKEGELSLWAKRIYFDTPLTCEVLNKFAPTTKPDRRCQPLPGDLDELVARVLPFFVVFKGLGASPVCVSRDGRVRQMHYGGRLLGDELGRSCEPMSTLNLPLPRNMTSKVPFVKRAVVLTQPWATAHFHWMTESFMRIGAAWELVVGGGHGRDAMDGAVRTKVHTAARTPRVLEQLRSVGVRDDQVITDAFCASEVIVPMVSNCGQGVSSLIMHVRQLTWMYQAAALHQRPADVSGDPWTAPAPTPARPTVVVVRRSESRTLVRHDEFLAWVRARVPTAYEVVDFRDDPVPSFPDTLDAFSRAAVVIAVHGAGLANIYACRTGTVIVELHFRVKMNMCFRGLAQSLGLEYHGFVPAEAPVDNEVVLSSPDLALIEGILAHAFQDDDADEGRAKAGRNEEAGQTGRNEEAGQTGRNQEAGQTGRNEEAGQTAVVNNMNNAAAERWTADDVSTWLRQLDLNDADKAVAAIRDEGIRGSHLKRLSHELLISLGIRTGDRLTILEGRDRLFDR